jgi:pyridoxamine 5'-phosphate oxidase family protein
MSFAAEEVAYLRSQPLGRLATVSQDGQPDVVPVGYDFDGRYLYVSGHGDTVKTRKFRNVLAGSAKVALVVDDLVSTRPWAPRFLRIYGTADVVERDGYVGQGAYLRITPTISWSWNFAGRPLTGEAGGDELAPRRTVHPPPSRDRETGQQDAALMASAAKGVPADEALNPGHPR